MRAAPCIVECARVLRIICLALALAVLGLTATTASAASVAYLDGEEVWIAALDGTSKTRLSAGEGDWRAVTAADSGRILGVANEAGKISQLSRIRLWDSAGTRISDGPLPSEVNSASTVIPLAMDLSSDGQFLAYGYSQFFSGFPTSAYYEGHYVVNADTKTRITPIGKSGETYPSFFGRRIVAIASDQNQIDLQQADSGPFGTTYQPWFQTAAALPLKQRRVDVAATGTVLAFELERYDGSTRAEAKVGVVPIAGIGGALNDPAGCFLPASGLASDVSISQDATRIAWKDDQGVKVAGIPNFSGVDDCVFTSPPVVISPTGSSPSIGGADAAAILRARTPAPPVLPGPLPRPLPRPVPPGPLPGPLPGPEGGARLALSGVVRLTAKAIISTRGVAISVQVTRAGPVTVRVTVPASRLGRRGAAVVVASGSARAKKAGRLTVLVKRTPAGRRGAARLRGARATVRVVQGTLRASRTVVLR